MCRRTPEVSIKQQGIALVVFAIILALAVITYTLGNVSIEQLRTEEVLSTQSALNRAKQALLAYAVTHEDSHPGEYGFLPCPDRVDGGPIDEGGSDGNCLVAGMNVLGLFPWASLETGILKSGTGQCLWYGVSGDYKSSHKAAMLNEDSNGAMRVYDPDVTPNDAIIRQGALAQDRVVAVIIDPSKVLPGQNRNFDNTSLCGKDYSPAAYLDGDNKINNAALSGGKWDTDNFIAKAVGTDERSPPFNDQLVFITREELWDAVRSRKDYIMNDDLAIKHQTKALAMCIAAYGNNSGNRKLPRPAAVDFGAGDYRDDDKYDDTAAVSYLGRYPHTVDDSDAALGAYAPNDSEEILFDKGYCDALEVEPGEPAINLYSEARAAAEEIAKAEGYTIWKNWKDHFFYAVSAGYAPTNLAATADPACAGANCIKVGDVEYAAVVLFAGRRTGAQVRNEPKAGDTDTKNTLANYIEVDNPTGDGTGDYTPKGNDIAYCITDADPLEVVSCK